MTTDRKAGMVRLTAQTRQDVDRYADDHGITYNAAMNMLVREGLRAVAARELEDPTHGNSGPGGRR